MATDGSRHLTDSVVERDRPVSQPSRRDALSGFLPACDRISAPAICIFPKWGSSPFHHRGDRPRNSEQFSSATGTCHRAGGRLIVRQTHWEGSPCPAWDGASSSRCSALLRRRGL